MIFRVNVICRHACTVDLYTHIIVVADKMLGMEKANQMAVCLRSTILSKLPYLSHAGDDMYVHVCVCLDRPRTCAPGRKGEKDFLTQTLNISQNKVFQIQFFKIQRT
jgi:hypothetical protein